MKALGELLFYFAFITITGNIAYKQIYKSIKKEAIVSVSKELPPLSKFTHKLTEE